MGGLSLGIDVGTSGVRTAVVDAAGQVVGTARVPFPAQRSGPVDAEDWWRAVEGCLIRQIAALEASGHNPKEIDRAAIDGTSGTMVLIDADLKPVTQGLMYNSAGFDAEADVIARFAPDNHITRGSNSALARMLRLQSEDPDRRARHVCHQADFVLARLIGTAGHSDDNNTLKLGFDPEAERWPDWFEAAGVRTELLPNVHRIGQEVGEISPEIAARLGLSTTLSLRAGTTDSIAAFLASGASRVGDAVTSLGTTLAIKLLSDVRVDHAAQGIYSHRLGDKWLAGGASNTGGGVLLGYFDADRIAELSRRIDPTMPSGLDYYPLSKHGERFPINDPNLPPRLDPRPAEDHLFLQGMLEGIATIEAACFVALQQLGAPPPTRILTAGGGAQNDVWTDIRRRIVSSNIEPSGETEASVGMALLCLDHTS
ncbi:MAG: FGGY-family carbohydrate kinase [Pseudomonadota bacterium]